MLPALDDAARSLLAKDAAILAASAPSDPDLLAVALRDLLAPLSPAADAPLVNPWTASLQAAAPAGDWLLPIQDKSAELAAPLATINTRLVAAQASPVYAPLADQAKRRIVAAAALVTAPPGWMTPPIKQAVLSQLIDAVRRAADEPQSLETLQRLERLDLLARIAAELDAQRGAAMAAGRAAMLKAASAGPPMDPSQRPGDIRRLEAVARAAAMLNTRESLRDEKRVVRQFRPALRTMLELARLSEQDLLEALPDVLAADNADAINAPKFISAMAAHRRRLDDLLVIGDASDAILRAQPAAAPGADKAARDEYRFLADRLLAFAKDAVELARKDDPLARDDLEAALSRVRSLAADCRDFALLPGEEVMRSAKPPADQPADDPLARHASDLLKQLDADRTIWLKRWASPDKHPLEEAARLRRLHSLMTALCDASQTKAIATNPKRLAAMNAWPGWEMPAEALTVLSAGLDAAVDSACKAALDKRDDGKALSSLVDRFAPALLAGRLARLLGPGFTVPPALELTAGTPPATTPMRDRLDDLAQICRESRELAARLAQGSPGADVLRASLLKTARACLAEAPPSSRKAPAEPAR